MYNQPFRSMCVVRHTEYLPEGFGQRMVQFGKECRQGCQHSHWICHFTNSNSSTIGLGKYDASSLVDLQPTRKVVRGFLAYLCCNYAHLPSFELARYELTDASTFVGHSESDEMFQRPMRSPRSILSPSKPAPLAEQYQIVLKWMCWMCLLFLVELLLLLTACSSTRGRPKCRKRKLNE